MLRVTSTVPDYLKLQNLEPIERESSWLNRYETTHADLFGIYHGAYGHPDGRAAAAALVPELALQIRARESRVLRTLEEVSSDFTRRGLAQADQDLDVVLMVGTGHSDAWVKVVNGEPVLFVALEMLTDTQRDELLVLHELAHVVHIRALLPLLAAQPELEHSVGMRVWLEGMAVAATRLLRPDHPETEFLFAPSAKWIHDCSAALPAIAATLLPNLTVSDSAIVYSLCGVTDDHPWPSRAGYWVGDQVVRELLDDGHELPELITWGPDRAAHALRASSVLAPHRGTLGS